MQWIDIHLAWRISWMRLQLRSERLRLRQYEREYRHLALFRVKYEFESIRQQRSHHQSHLLLGRVGLRRPRLNVEPVGHRPMGQLRLNQVYLIAHQIVSEGYIGHERKVRRGEEPAIRGVHVACVERKV